MVLGVALACDEGQPVVTPTNGPTADTASRAPAGGVAGEPPADAASVRTADAAIRAPAGVTGEPPAGAANVRAADAATRAPGGMTGESPAGAANVQTAVEAADVRTAVEATGASAGAGTTCSAAEATKTKLWVQVDDPFAADGAAARMNIAVDGRDVLQIDLRRQGARMTHEHWGRATAELLLCRSEVAFAVRVSPSGPAHEQTLDLKRGAFLVLSRGGAGVAVKQYRAQPLYR